MSRSDKWINISTRAGTEVGDGLKTYTIDAIPFDDAPYNSLGKERLRIREDSVLIEALYYDRDMQPLPHR